MKELVEVIAKALVDNPDEVKVTESKEQVSGQEYIKILCEWEEEIIAKVGHEKMEVVLYEITVEEFLLEFTKQKTKALSKSF